MQNNQTELAATYQVGIVTAVDPHKHNVRVQFPALDNLESDWLSVVTPAAGGNQFYSLPDQGAMVACLLDSRGEGGCVVGCLYNEIDPTPIGDNNVWMMSFKNGTIISHDRNTGEVLVKTSGQVKVKASSVTIDATDTTITGNLLVKKKLTNLGGMEGSGGDGAAVSITGSIQVKNGDIVADGISFKTHTHPDLTSGGNTGQAQ